uniref:Protein kinase domain-containing protein n=1 Tax=Arcella intermedia TaxID=1963864 RepID=A0A6B2LIN1_9EUKA
MHRHITVRDLSNLEPLSHDTVYRGRYGNMIVAVKFFRPYFIGFEWSRFRREVAILGICKHPHIISFIGANVPDAKEIEQSNWQDEGSSLRPFIVSEYLPETLSDVIRTSHRVLPFNVALRYTYQIATALEFLHSMSLVHRDIKPANIVLSADGQKAKLIDFGESRIVSGPREPLTKVGTPFYEAPEGKDTPI